MFYNVHAQCPDFEMNNNTMELSETGEAEEDVDNVGGQLCALLPVFSEHPGQCPNHSF